MQTLVTINLEYSPIVGYNSGTMSPENARVFLVEDNNRKRGLIIEVLEDAGHKIGLVATSLPEALKLIDKLRKERINVAIVDGSLDPDISNTDDGETIAEEIKSKFPEITVIGHAYEDGLRNADHNSPKINGILALADLVTKV